jgi:homoserine dehydrogenase
MIGMTSPQAQPRHPRVVLLGGGTVGSEVARALLEPAGGAAASGLELAGIAVRDLDRAVARGLPAGLLTDAPAHLVAEADVVVELLGGEEPARTLIAAALAAGLPVVTANKLVLARHGAELEALARRTGAALRFEAAVMGGTPIVRVLAEDLAATRVAALRGIVNGTTNHVLSEMASRGIDYGDALAAAQAAGYAEADPTADVEGDDAADKLVILARLAFGVWLARASIPLALPGAAPGISGIGGPDVAAAVRAGHRIRLLAAAARHEPSGAIDAAVLPVAVPAVSPLGLTSGVRNRVELRVDPLGLVAIEGPGAGGPATAAAVLADLRAAAGGRGSSWGRLPPAERAAPTSGGGPAAAAGSALAASDVFVAPTGARYPVAVPW